MSFRSVLDELQAEASAASWFAARLAALAWRAFYWECPPLEVATLDDPFECVALEAPFLTDLAEPEAFRARLDAAAPGALVAVFPNLGGDAVLVVPTDAGDRSAYPHLGAFLRAAPQSQIVAFFAAIAREGLNASRKGPAWVSTAGDGVAWLHGRVDERAKYYRHLPYCVPRL